MAEAELALCKGVRCFGEGRSDVGDRLGADGERIWEKKLCKIISHNRSCRGWRWRRRDGIITILVKAQLIILENPPDLPFMAVCAAQKVSRVPPSLQGYRETR